MRKIVLGASLLVLILTSLAAAQMELKPTNVDMTIELIPAEKLIRVDFAVALEQSHMADGKFSFGIGEDYKVTKAFFDPEKPLKYIQEPEGVSVETGTFKPGSRLHIKYQAWANALSRGKAYVGEDGCYFGWLSGWIPFLPGSSGFIGNIVVTAPENIVVATQGKCVSKEKSGELTITEFKVEKPCYFSLMAAPYQEYKKEIDGIEYRTYFLEGGKERADFYFKHLHQTRKAIEIHYGPYPYDYLCVLEAPPIAGLRLLGSSEQGLLALDSGVCSGDYFNFPIVAHEVAHMWFGNWVIGFTPAMSETFAQLGYLLATETVYGEELMRKYVLNGSPDHFMTAQLYLRQFADSSEKEPNLEVMSYNYPEYLVIQGKGPSVFLMLRDQIGQEAFTKGFTTAVEKYAHTRMTMKQLKGEFEIAAQQELGWFFDQWIYKAGAPRLKLTWSQKKSADRYMVSGKVIQTGEPYYCMPIEVVARSEAGEVKQYVKLKGEENKFHIFCKSVPAEVVLDPQRRSLWFAESDKGKADYASALGFGIKLEEERKRIEEYLVRNPDDQFAKARIAKLTLSHKPGSDEAIKVLSEFIKSNDPHGELEIFHSWATWELAAIYAEEGRNAEAKELLEKLIKQDRTRRYKVRIAKLLKTFSSGNTG